MGVGVRMAELPHVHVQISRGLLPSSIDVAVDVREAIVRNAIFLMDQTCCVLRLLIELHLRVDFLILIFSSLYVLITVILWLRLNSHRPWHNPRVTASTIDWSDCHL